MYNNVGRKLKSASQVVFVIGMIASVLLGLYYLYLSIVGLLVIGLSCIGVWISCLCLYGFGQLIENTDKIVAMKEQVPAPRKLQIEDIENDLPKL